MLSRKTKVISVRSPIATRSVTSGRQVNVSKTLKRKINSAINKMTQVPPPQTVHHEVYTSTVDIPKFSGESGSIGLEDYIARVQTYIANKGIKNEAQKIEAFKANIDAEKGKAKVLVNCRYFSGIKDYNNFLTEFKKHFIEPSECEPLRCIVKYLQMQEKPHESDADYIGRLDTFSNQIENALKGSQWTAAGHQDKITVENFSKILMMAKMIAKCTGNMPEKLYKDLDPSVNIVQIDYMISEYRKKDPHSQQWVMPIRTQSPSPSRGERHSRPRTPSHKYTRARSISKPRTQCYTCSKMGHTARECESQLTCGNCQYQGHHENRCRNQPWCVYHQMIGHRTRDCRRGSKRNFRVAPPDRDGGQTSPGTQ